MQIKRPYIKVDTNKNITPQTPIQSSLLDAPLIMEVETNDNIVITPITTDTKKRPALTNLTQNENTSSKPSTTKTSQPATKKMKRNKSVENIILQLDEILEPIKTKFEEIPNKKISYNQFKYIIENSIGLSNPETALTNFNITSLEMIEMIEIIKPKIKAQNMKNRLTRLCNSLLDKALSTEQVQD